MTHARLAALALALILVPTVAPATDAGDANRLWSTIPPGPFGALPVVADNFTASDGTHVSYAVFRPDVPDGARVPVILSAGPYFALLEEPVNVPSTQRLTGFLVDNFVSHGYAVVAASVRGTGWSGGCMELMSLREAMDVSELVTFLAGEAWSNGRVGLIGKSYDGGVAWEVAALGNPHLETIVPIAGVSDMGDLVVRHGVAESRAPIFHNYVYWPFGFAVDPDVPGHETGRSLEDRAANAACPEVVEGTASAVAATVTGDRLLLPVAKDYWAERAFRERTAANFDGSVFIVHGLQDYNVNPSQVAPAFSALPQEKKMWLGQWDHQYPDENVAGRRADFAAVLKAWFDRSLKGMDVNTGPVVEVQDGRDRSWRSYADWPAPAGERVLGLRGDGSLSATGGDAFERPLATPNGVYFGDPCVDSPTFPVPPSQPAARVGLDRSAKFVTNADASFRLSGIPEVTVRLDPATTGNVVATLCVGGAVVTQGATSMLYSKGTNDLTPYVPGLPLDVRVELEPVEHTVRAGQRVVLAIAIDDNRYDNVALSPGVAVLAGGTLTLPVG